jgi:cell division septation protein DedD
MTTDIERGGLDVGGSHEPSYYEIALTNRQVMVAFVVLLVCVVAAFLAGVWLGRESAVRAQEKLTLLTRGAAAGVPGSDAGSDKEKPEGQALQEFKFFADSRHRSAEAGASPASRNGGNGGNAGNSGTAGNTAAANGDDSAAPAAGDDGNTVTPDSNRAAAAPAKAGAGRAPGAAAFPPSSAPPANNVSTPAGRPGQAGRAGSSPPSSNAASPAAAQKTAKAAPAAAPAGEGETQPAADNGGDVVRPRPLPDGGGRAGAGDKAAGGEVVIQVFSSADKEQADRVKDGLVGHGFAAFLSPIDKDGQTMYRVRIGPFANRAAAEPVADKVRKEQKLDTWITPK